MQDYLEKLTTLLFAKIVKESKYGAVQEFHKMHSPSRATPRAFTISTTVHRVFAADTMTVRGHELGQDVVHVRAAVPSGEGPSHLIFFLVNYDLPADHPVRGVPLAVERY